MPPATNPCPAWTPCAATSGDGKAGTAASPSATSSTTAGHSAYRPPSSVPRQRSRTPAPPAPGVTLAPAVPPGVMPTGLPAQAAPVRHVLADPRLGEPLVLGYRGIQESDMGDSMVEQEVLMAAHEGSDHAEQAEEHGIGAATLEQLRADLVRLSRLSRYRRAVPAVHRTCGGCARESTDCSTGGCGRASRPTCTSCSAASTGSMGITANRLGYPDAAEELNRAGFAYANAIDHRPLMAWLRDELAFYAYYRGRFEESRDLALSGLQYLSVGPHGARLHIYHARAAARLGDADAARQAVRDAHEARDRDYNDELLEIGGELPHLGGHPLWPGRCRAHRDRRRRTRGGGGTRTRHRLVRRRPKAGRGSLVRWQAASGHRPGRSPAPVRSPGCRRRGAANRRCRFLPHSGSSE